MISYFEIKKNLFKIILISIIFIILLKQIDFFKKVYFILTKSYDTRMVNSYEYCGGESIGFLNYIKTSFNITYKVPIINFEISPNSSWFFNDLKKMTSNKVIFLNFNKKIENLDSNVVRDYSFELDDYNVIYSSDSCYYLEKK